MRLSTEPVLRVSVKAFHQKIIYFPNIVKMLHLSYNVGWIEPVRSDFYQVNGNSIFITTDPPNGNPYGVQILLKRIKYF